MVTMWMMELAPVQDYFHVEHAAGEVYHGQDQAGPQTLQMIQHEKKLW